MLRWIAFTGFAVLGAGMAMVTVAPVTAQQEAPPPAERVVEPVQANPNPPPAPNQPLPYSHQWHVGELGLDCTTCHVNPDPGNMMTFPATQTCMDCHSDIAIEKEPIQRLTQYHEAQEQIPWERVYQVLPGVTWSHRTHIDAGVDCTSCHSAVSEMPQMQEVTAVTSMASCMNCHEQQGAPNTCVTCHSWPNAGNTP
ncbi:cytochrome c3 family protein [Paracoccus zhejiangensis]|uniref:Cytochrome c7-like domain-containing protein n=1 Tax=Paracoccus zhejiangensis TaxID=1077935 RepID=A0A2H5F200_9RHOB|nr:cytochrome c3 family protein [Paracoccus zhejiangensis]AUH65589.1 hypothetical protein CX676_16725 [Paracoccus zhejiangensis]